MSLYDDEDLPMSSTAAAAPGWSQGVKLLQTQLQLKKATHAATARKDSPAGQKSKSVLPPVKDFKKTKKDVESSEGGKFSFTPAAMVGLVLTLTTQNSLNDHFSLSSTEEWTACCPWT